MKQVLLLGDSIRMGYEPIVREALKGKAEVSGPMENGRWAGYTLNSLRFWTRMLPEQVDVIHWNNGLWDLGDDYDLGRPFSLPEEYVSALERMVIVLQKTYPGAQIIMATTTPTARGELEGIMHYNQLLKDVAAKNNLPVDDLFPTVLEKRDTLISPDGVHLTQEGWNIVGAQVAAFIEQYL